MAKRDTELAKLRKRAFASFYCGSCRGNGVEAARAAGYTGKDRSLATVASRHLKDPMVRKIIEAYQTKIDVETAEILGVLIGQMRGDMTDFVTVNGPDDVALDMEKALELQQVKIVHKLKQTTREWADQDGGTKRERKVEVELYDAQAAAAHLAKIKGMVRNDVNIRAAGSGVRLTLELPGGDPSDEAESKE